MIYIAFIIFTILVLWFAFYQWQYFMIFTPTYHREGSLSTFTQILSVTTDDGVELEGVVYEPQDASATLLFFAGRHHDVVGIINKLSCAFPTLRVISFNYRAYGRSGGVANEKNLLSDAEFIAGLVQKNYGDFYTMGYSLGSNIAASLASKHKTTALFLVGAFDSIASLAKSKFVDRGIFPMVDLSSVFRYKLRTGEYVKSVDAPTYLYVSVSDETTYIQNARELKSKIKNLSSYVEYEGLSHKEILWDERVVKNINEVIAS